jgi:hypothetical protein
MINLSPFSVTKKDPSSHNKKYGMGGLPAIGYSSPTAVVSHTNGTIELLKVLSADAAEVLSTSGAVVVSTD